MGLGVGGERVTGRKLPTGAVKFVKKKLALRSAAALRRQGGRSVTSNNGGSRRQRVKRKN